MNNVEKNNNINENMDEDMNQNINENVKEMITQFEECASAAGILSESIEKLANIFTRLDTNIERLSQTEQKLRNNDAFNKLLSITDSTKEMFNQLNKTLQISKRDIENQGNDVHTALENIQSLTASFNNDNMALKDAATQINDSVKEFKIDIMGSLNNNIRDAVNAAVNRAVNENNEYILSKIKNTVTDVLTEYINVNKAEKSE